MRRLFALTLLVLLWPTAAAAQRLEIGIGPLVHRLDNFPEERNGGRAGLAADLFLVLGRPDESRAIGLVLELDRGNWGSWPATGFPIRQENALYAGVRVRHFRQSRVSFFWQVTAGILRSSRLNCLGCSTVIRDSNFSAGAGLGLQVRLNRWLDAKYQFDLHQYDMFQNDDRIARHLGAFVFKLWR